MAEPARLRTASNGAAFAYAAGTVGSIANLALIALYASWAVHPDWANALGTANDLIGAVGSALLVPVVAGLRSHLPRRQAVEIIQAVGIFASTILTLSGLLLVAGALPFDVSTPISLVAYLLFAVWLLLANSWLRRSGELGDRLPRLGRCLAAAALIGAAVAGLGLVAPTRSWPQMAMFATGGALAAITILGTPIWLLLLGRRLSSLRPERPDRLGGATDAAAPNEATP